MLNVMLICLMSLGQLRNDTSSYLALPIYPALSARAGIEGDFTVRLEIAGGQAQKVEITNSITSSPYLREKYEGPSAFCDEMKQAITNALSHWQFQTKQKSTFILMVSFRHKSLTQEIEKQE